MPPSTAGSLVSVAANTVCRMAVCKRGVDKRLALYVPAKARCQTRNAPHVERIDRVEDVHDDRPAMRIASGPGPLSPRSRTPSLLKPVLHRTAIVVVIDALEQVLRSRWCPAQAASAAPSAF